MLVDAAINYYGKPYHTLVTIGSLLEHSGQHIDKVYLIKEPKQPAGGEAIVELLARHDWNVEIFTPQFYFGWRAPKYYHELRVLKLMMYRWSRYRWSIRYQYALEHTDKPYMFLTHNDVLFKADALAPMLDRIGQGGHAGVGDIGGCWKCPALAAAVCTDRNPGQLELTPAAAKALYEQHPSPHRNPNVPPLDPNNPVPFPECRLNEWYALLDTNAYRKEVAPQGDTEPIGSTALGDTGIAWFRSMMHKGYSFEHVVGDYSHPWTPNRGGGGPEALFDTDLYEEEESTAQRYYLEHYAPR